MKLSFNPKASTFVPSGAAAAPAAAAAAPAAAAPAANAAAPAEAAPVAAPVVAPAVAVAAASVAAPAAAATGEKKETVPASPAVKPAAPAAPSAVAPDTPVDDAELADELRRIAEEEAAAAAPVPIRSNGKPHINVVCRAIVWAVLRWSSDAGMQVFIGHVDHGKSTMSGAILLACGMVNSRDVEKLQKDAEAAGRVSRLALCGVAPLR